MNYCVIRFFLNASFIVKLSFCFMTIFFFFSCLLCFQKKALLLKERGHLE